MHRVVLTELNKVDSVDSVDPRVAEVDRSPWPRWPSVCIHEIHAHGDLNMTNSAGRVLIKLQRRGTTAECGAFNPAVFNLGGLREFVIFIAN